MINRWDDEYAASLQDDLSLRVYSSRLLGQDDSLVLHGGGNTSVKTRTRTLLGEELEVLCVKGSGWDLQTIEAEGFSAVKLDALLALSKLESLSDSDMVKQQRAAMIDPFAPNPSVEAILHAVIPYKFVDHTHADAILTINNSPEGEPILRQIMGDKVIFIPYVMPGFDLAKKVVELTKDLDWRQYEGMLLLKHGLFSFADDAKSSYARMIELVDKAEQYLNKHAALDIPQQADGKWQVEELTLLCQLRKMVSKRRGKPQVVQSNLSPLAHSFASHANLNKMSQQGPMTPDHVIRNKRLPLLVNLETAGSIGGIESCVEEYANSYIQYFERNSKRLDANLSCLDPAPRWAVWPNKGCLSFGDSMAAAGIVTDINQHTMQAILRAEKLGAWEALSEQDIFEVEYWELEQAKLKKTSSVSEFQARIVLVTGAANGIGRACVDYFLVRGAMVIALDIDERIGNMFDSAAVFATQCDVTDDQALQQSVQAGVANFGGLDIVICNAGVFPASETIENMSAEVWQRSLDINLSSQQRLLQYTIPYLKFGLDANVVFIASKNVPAPGPGAGAYSVAKAGVTQLARIAALELAGYGIRVNALHPDAVFDTSIWTDEVLSKRAAYYNMSVAEYKTKNLLKTEIHSMDVAALVGAVAGHAFSKTTAAQIPIDGGNDRVV